MVTSLSRVRLLSAEGGLAARHHGSNGGRYEWDQCPHAWLLRKFCYYYQVSIFLSSFLLSSSTRRRFCPWRPGQVVVTGVVPSSPRYVASFSSRIGFNIPTVGRTHTIVRLQTRTRRKDGTENFGGFVYVLDGFLQRDFLLWVFMCSINFSLFSVSLFRLPRRGLPHPTALFYGYHARTDASKLTGYHVCRVTTPDLPRPI